ncbi:hypothetical protein QI122_03600 [Staphylococcus saprophyticus]|nr:hypothetical protein [Staphylococcus saprophyticus]MDW4332159.1 hypothetical protein [Staphylococcus saprophyticus]
MNNKDICQFLAAFKGGPSISGDENITLQNKVKFMINSGYIIINNNKKIKSLDDLSNIKITQKGNDYYENNCKL